MNWISAAAVFFIIWWVVLFIALPIGLRTQEENEDVTLGTTPSAPRGPHMARVFIRTTVIAVAVFAAYYITVGVFGITLDDLPVMGPPR